MDREREKCPKKLEVGMDVIRKPRTICDDNEHDNKQSKYMRGYVCYIHPKGRYHTVAFSLHGVIVRESFQGVRYEP